MVTQHVGSYRGFEYCDNDRQNRLTSIRFVNVDSCLGFVEGMILIHGDLQQVALCLLEASRIGSKRVERCEVFANELRTVPAIADPSSGVRFQTTKADAFAYRVASTRNGSGRPPRQSGKSCPGVAS